MPSAQRASRPAEASWVAAGWFCVLVLGAALAWAMCLPVVPAHAWSTPPADAVFHVEWFLATAVLAVPIWHTARCSWAFGVAGVVIAGLQVYSIGDEGARRLQQVGVLSAITDLLYIAAALEIVLFVSVGVSGILRDLADRRVARLVAQLAALDTTSEKHQY
jgi:hypothetical protein